MPSVSFLKTLMAEY